MTVDDLNIYSRLEVKKCFRYVYMNYRQKILILIFKLGLIPVNGVP